MTLADDVDGGADKQLVLRSQSTALTLPGFSNFKEILEIAETEPSRALALLDAQDLEVTREPNGRDGVQDSR
jgi:hypothetical protein